GFSSRRAGPGAQKEWPGTNSAEEDDVCHEERRCRAQADAGERVAERGIANGRRFGDRGSGIGVRGIRAAGSRPATRDPRPRTALARQRPFHYGASEGFDVRCDEGVEIPDTINAQARAVELPHDILRRLQRLDVIALAQMFARAIDDASIVQPLGEATAWID